MSVTVVTPPDPLIEWAVVDKHLRLFGDESDKSYIEDVLLAAATGHIDGPDGWLGRAIGRQVLEARFSAAEACGRCLRLLCPPIVDLVGVTYIDAAGVEQTADLADFVVSGRDLFPAGAAWAWSGASRRRDAIRIQYRAGYLATPKPIAAAILMMLGDLYANRETTVASANAVAVPMSITVQALLRPFQVFD